MKALLQLWHDRRVYLDEALEKGAYFRAVDKHLLGNIPALAKALEEGEQDVYRKVRRRLVYRRLWTARRRRVLRLALRIIWILFIVLSAIRGLIH